MDQGKSDSQKTITGLPRNTEAALCYLGLWLTGLAFLLLEKKDDFIRFHAMQSLVIFAPLTVLTSIPFFGQFLAAPIWLVIFIVWLVGIVKAYEGERFKFPIVGDFVERQLK